MGFCVCRLAALSVALSFLSGGTVHGLEPATPLARLARQAWTMENGLPQNTITALLQSRSGYLWVGTELGLARFDGASFRVFDHATAAPFPDAEVRCLLDSASGELWVGTGDGLVRWVKDVPALLTTQAGLPSNSIRGLAQSTDGAVWAWTEGGIARWDGQRFQAMTPAEGGRHAEINSMAADVNGDLWLGTASGVERMHEGRWSRWPELQGADASEWKETSRAGVSLVVKAASGDVLIAAPGGIFVDHEGRVSAAGSGKALPLNGVSFLAQLADGTIVAGSKNAVVLLASPDAGGRTTTRLEVGNGLPGTRIETLYPDREGALWVGTNGGLARIRSGPGWSSADQLPPTDPLAASDVVALLEDREGDLWVGTESAGLHILRDARFRILGAAEGLSSDATTAIVEDARGSLWVGTRDAGLNRLSGGETTTLTTRTGLLSNVILSLAAAPDGSVWVGTPDGLSRIDGKRVTSFTSADGLPDDFIRSVLAAADGSVWIGTRRGLTHFDHGRFQTLTTSDGLGSDLIGAMALGADGDLWIATLNGLSRLHQGKLRNFTTADGLSSNVITALDVSPDGRLWVGTQNDGLNLWDGKRFIKVGGGQVGGARLPEAIHAILRDDRGHLWLASNAGLTRADTQSLVDCAMRRPCTVKASNFTTADGLRSRETSSNSHPTAWRGRDGELWFTTPRGVIAIDPQHFAPMPEAPPVVVERFAVDGMDEPVGSEARITAGHQSFEFDYAGLSFAAPQKLRYQYMLQGFDHGWVDAGARRTAYYTNLPPGKYRFLVRAAFAESTAPSASEAAQGSASAAPADTSEADFNFELLPHFYQTIWFRALAVLLLATLILWYSRHRVLRVRRELAAVMRERNRIAREIHDTLAQGYVGISLQLEILGQLLRLNRTEAAVKHLATTQELVREGLEDARQSIWALRSHDAQEQALPIRLRRLVEKAGDARLTSDLEVHGAYRALAPEVEKEILRIAQEAIQNVKRHAGASRLSARLDYDERMLTLSIADDGKGFDPAAKPGGGHFGLTGMRERATLIRAELEIESTAGKGTTVRLQVAAGGEAKRADAEEEAGREFSGKIEE